MKKEKHVETELEIIRFTTENVLLTSGGIPAEDEEVTGQAP